MVNVRVVVMASLAAVIVLILCTVAAPFARAADDSGPVKVYVDYTGACGGSLIEANRRRNIEKQANSVIRKLKKEGREYVVIVHDPSVVKGYYERYGSRKSIPVYNRNYSCY